MSNKRINNKDYLNLNESIQRMNEQVDGGEGGEGGDAGGGIMPMPALKQWYKLSPYKPIVDKLTTARPPCTTPACMITRCMENPPCDWKALFIRIGNTNWYNK